MNKKKLWNLLVTLAAIVFVIVGAGVIHVFADTKSVSVTEIDYENLTLTVKANEEDTRVFFATTKNAAVWEELPGGVDENQQATMDISWMSVSSNVSLYLKGDKSKAVVKVIVPKQNTKFKAKFNIVDNTVNFFNMKDAKEVYWKKSNSTEWILFQNDDEAEKKEFANMIESFCANGITLQFRTAQVKGTSAEEVGARPSAISSVTITKRASAPSVSLNYNTLMFGVKKTLEYKLSDSEIWSEVTSAKLYLEDVIPNAIYDESLQTDNSEKTIPIEFRTKATSSKVASQICKLEVPVQERTLLDNVVFSYTSSRQCKIKIIEKELFDGTVIPAASSENPYEYTIVKGGDTFNVHTAKWNTIVSKTTKISSSIAPKNSKIYLRKKATNNKLATKAVVVSEGVDFSNQDTELPAISSDHVEVCFKTSEAVKNTQTEQETLIDCGYHITVADGGSAGEVSVKEIDYESKTIMINPNGNTKVYYSNKAQKNWIQIEGNTDKNGCLLMDISWISANSDYELVLKGSDNETVVSVELPKANNSLKVTFDKIDGVIEFANEENASCFEWRKATATGEWSKAPIELMDATGTDKTLAEDFMQQIEAMRVKGGKISVRIPQTKGTSAEVTGERQSKTVTVNITVRGTAPAVKVSSNTMLTNTTTSMEYRICSVEDKEKSGSWMECEKSMSVSELASDAISENGNSGKNVVVAVRKAETEKIPYSKVMYLEIPGQRIAPDHGVVSISRTTKKFSVMISDASTEKLYQYAVVKAGKEVQDSKLSWKNVTDSKGVSFSSSSYPSGSTIYIRLKGKNQTTTTSLQLPSAYMKKRISYLTE